eukprot:CAMPEP_0119292910 /NCGR_PEP_ID=MMETSP1329-20130426/45051_1 /TAXON_ID=114041 /ORGANISM="Genus nov. species nov., Strain RCC1024" /LENGTH=171 /DNA_ID=CAMNT_0007293763 /DNA_START=127 /DNA_END=639 /DNA_ORIENTATION=-
MAGETLSMLFSPLRLGAPPAARAWAETGAGREPVKADTPWASIEAAAEGSTGVPEATPEEDIVPVNGRMCIFKGRVVERIPGSPERSEPMSFVHLKVPPLGRKPGLFFSPTGVNQLDETSPPASFERRQYPYGRAKQVAFSVKPKFAAADKLPEPPRSSEGCLGPCKAFGW